MWRLIAVLVVSLVLLAGCISWRPLVDIGLDQALDAGIRAAEQDVGEEMSAPFKVALKGRVKERFWNIVGR